MNCLMTAWHDNEAELRGWLRHRLGNPVDADDMLQDLFIKALRQGERFCAIDNARVAVRSGAQCVGRPHAPQARDDRTARGPACPQAAA